MPKRITNHHSHLGEQRKREGALARLEVQLTKLKKNDAQALHSKKGDEPTKANFDNKIKYVQAQIDILKGKITKTY